MLSLRRVLFVLPFSLGLVLSACNTTNPSHPDNPQKVSAVGPEIVLVHDLVIPPPPATAVKDALTYLARERDRWLAAIPHPVSPPHPATVPHSAAPAIVAAPAAMDVASVMACIRDHESGDYTNHSNGPEGASGAYQYIGSTWRAWSARAGYGGYSAAWLAPPTVQDAVTVYTLTHGGAGNWSPRWGDDPCTVGFGG